MPEARAADVSGPKKGEIVQQGSTLILVISVRNMNLK